MPFAFQRPGHRPRARSGRSSISLPGFFTVASRLFTSALRDVHGASVALPVVAAFFSSKQAEIFAQRVQQRDAWFNL
jgi:hypothetical protein